MQNHNSIKTALLYMKEVEQTKVAVLGECYSSLGELVWQILSEIHLHTIDRVGFSGIALIRSMAFPESITRRLVAILESEGLGELSGEFETQLEGQLSLSELGVSKVTQIVDRITSESLHEMNTTDAEVFSARR